MSEVVHSIKPTPSISPNVIHIEGKIDHVESYEGKQYIEVILPAADAYSAPSRAKIVSARPLGSVGQEIAVECSLQGYVQTFRINNGVRQGQQGRDVKTWFVPVGQ